MFSFICILILIGIAMVFFIWRRYRWTETRGYGNEPVERSVSIWAWGFIPLGLALIWLALVCTVVVPAKNVGVVTTFGKVSERNLSSGLHLKAPWQKVTTLDATIITDKFVGEQNGDDGRKGDNGLDCVPVRISDGTNACVSVVIRSQIDGQKANDLYANYRSDDVDENIFDSLIRTQLSSAVAQTFRDFDPILTTNGGEVAAASPDLQALSGDVLDNMKDLLAKASVDGDPEVDMRALTISAIRFSDKTEDRINDLQAEVARTRVAEQQIITNEKQALANQKLAESVSKDPNVLVSRCIDVMTAMQQAGQNFPPGFTCWPGGDQGQLVYQGTKP